MKDEQILMEMIGQLMDRQFVHGRFDCNNSQWVTMIDNRVVTGSDKNTLKQSLAYSLGKLALEGESALSH